MMAGGQFFFLFATTLLNVNFLHSCLGHDRITISKQSRSLRSLL
jgi:hypothetical protein